MKRKIYDQIMVNKLFPKTLEINTSDKIKNEDDDVKEKKIFFDLKKFCKDNKITDCLKNL